MDITQEFQNEIELKMNKYFQLKFSQLIENNSQNVSDIIYEYKRQYEIIINNSENKNIDVTNIEYSKVLLSALSEPKTYYKLGDFLDNENDDNIYSPRIDFAFSPVINMKRGKNRSIGVYKLTLDVNLYKMIHKLDFIKEIEMKLRAISNENLNEHSMQTSDIGERDHCEEDYINRRPLHLFGFEIENQKNPKHLMGDFLNAISLSRIPVVIVPEDKYINMMKMLKFSSTIRDLKSVPIYDILSNVNVLKIKQFRECMNELLRRESLEEIQTMIE